MRRYLECQCTDVNHVVRVSVEEYEDGDIEFYIETQLYQHNSILKRIGLAIGYILNLKTKDCYWDCTILEDNDILELKNICEECLAGKRKPPKKSNLPI